MRLLLLIEFLLLSVLITGCKKEYYTVYDDIPPVIILYGENPMTVTLNSMFADPGAYARDNVDGTRSLSDNIIITHNIPINGPVNGNGVTLSVGTYKIIYTVKDRSGNTCKTSRTVIVKNKSVNYAGIYVFDKTGGDYFFPNFNDLLTSIECDSFINNRIIFTKISNNPAFRVYADISGDSMIVIPDQCFILNDTLTQNEILYRIRGIPQQSHVIDSILPVLSINYQLDIYHETSGPGSDFYFSNRFWQSVGYSANTELYERFSK